MRATQRVLRLLLCPWPKLNTRSTFNRRPGKAAQSLGSLWAVHAGGRIWYAHIPVRILSMSPIAVQRVLSLDRSKAKTNRWLTFSRQPGPLYHSLIIHARSRRPLTGCTILLPAWMSCNLRNATNAPCTVLPMDQPCGFDGRTLWLLGNHTAAMGECKHVDPISL